MAEELEFRRAKKLEDMSRAQQLTANARVSDLKTTMAIIELSNWAAKGLRYLIIRVGHMVRELRFGAGKTCHVSHNRDGQRPQVRQSRCCSYRMPRL